MKGFTLIELLVVIAIIGVICFVLSSAFTGKNDECLSYKDTPTSSIPGKCLKYFR